MQIAYSHGVKGFVKKTDGNKLLVEVEGTKEQLINFVRHIEGHPIWINAEIIEYSDTEVKNYKEFNIL